jgi:hypothetical protein
MSFDLTSFLCEFQFEAGRINARLARANDGRQLVQVRVELGVLQMECDGRPDGLESVLPRAEAEVRSASAARGAGLSPTTAAQIRLEMVQLQQRAVAFLAVGDPSRALRDADAVLHGTGMIIEHGVDADREWAEGARFSVVVLRTRCAAAALAASGRQREAGAAIESGLRMLREAAERISIGEHFDTLSDVTALRALRDTLVPQLPPAQRSELEARLRAAVLAENFELAAILRDELRML